MGEPLSAIMAAIKAIELALTPPAGLAAIADVQDEPPYNLTAFPAFVNAEASTDVRTKRTFGTVGLSELDHYIELALVFAPPDQRFSVAARRSWLPVVIEAFHAQPGLNATCDGAYVESVDHRAAHISGTDYPGLTFRLHVIAST